MKIGILTQPLLVNYGGILQAYALQETLMRMGHQTIILSRRKAKEKRSLKLYVARVLSLFKCIYRVYFIKQDNCLIENPFSYEYFPVKYPKCFIGSHIKCSSAIYSSAELYKQIKENAIETIVVGSDQVWRERYSPCITDFFCCFLPSTETLPCLSYAASFGLDGHDISSDKLEECKKGLKKFVAISVREKSAIDTVKTSFGVSAQFVLDPTLLLSDNDYTKLIEEEDIKDEPSGIVSYILDTSTDKTLILNAVREKFNLTTNRHTDLRLYQFGKDAGYVEGIVPSVGKWLQSIRDAEFVVTDSFHGCVFSIVFKKQFIVIGNHQRGLERFISLLSEFGLGSRVVLSFDDFEKNKKELFKPIDFKAVYDNYARCRKHSLEWLRTNLKQHF